VARKDPEHFADLDATLVYVARKLRHATRVEALLTEAGIDYAVETDVVASGLLFRTERMGAFFYVAPDDRPRAAAALAREGFALIVAGDERPV
jgi:hypothetical protein